MVRFALRFPLGMCCGWGECCCVAVAELKTLDLFASTEFEVLCKAEAPIKCGIFVRDWLRSGETVPCLAILLVHVHIPLLLLFDRSCSARLLRIG